MACLSDQDCIAFLALSDFHEIQSPCHKRKKEYQVNYKKDDFKLCPKNHPLKNEMFIMMQYYESCFHDAYVKSNEPGSFI